MQRSARFSDASNFVEKKGSFGTINIIKHVFVVRRKKVNERIESKP